MTYRFKLKITDLHKYCTKVVEESTRAVHSAAGEKFYDM